MKTSRPPCSLPENKQSHGQQSKNLLKNGIIVNSTRITMPLDYTGKEQRKG